MNIVYYCYGSAHSSVTAANIHLGHLPTQRRASLTEIIHQPLFDRAENHEIGELRYMGTDPWGDQIFVIGLAGSKLVMVHSLQDFLLEAGMEPGLVRFEDALQHAGLPLRIGGYTSRRLGIVGLGRLLSGLGVWLRYHRFVNHVQRVLQHLQSNQIE